MPAVEAIVWKLLNKEVSVHFGTECAAVATWTVIVMVIRFVLQLAKIIDYVPVGLIFAFPLIIQTFSKFLPTLKGRSPLLVIRLAESLVAKDHIGKLFALFPAHFLGSVIGIVFFRTILPFVSKQTLSPLHCASENVPVILITETVANFIYAAVILVLPYVLDVNRLHGWYINIPLLPLLSISISTFNPAILFGLWALNTNVLANNDCPLSITRIAGSCLGGLFAGWFCSNYFPDDPSSWTRSSKKSSK